MPVASTKIKLSVERLLKQIIASNSPVMAGFVEKKKLNNLRTCSPLQSKLIPSLIIIVWLYSPSRALASPLGLRNNKLFTGLDC
jgi:hypothetical protein